MTRIAFPNLFLKSGIESEISKMSSTYRSMRPLLIDALTDLNDILFPLVGQGIDGREIVRRFNSLSFQLVRNLPTLTKMQRQCVLVTLRSVVKWCVANGI
jgi:hypothetical protein